MLMRSLVLHNEFVNMIDFGKLRGIKTRAELDAHHPLELMDVGNSTVDFQRAQDFIAPVRVGSALLAEPLRLYYQAISEVPALRLGEIEGNRRSRPGSAGPQELSKHCVSRCT